MKKSIAVSILALQDTFDHAIQRIKSNISPIGSINGSVIASPSKINPDYYYHWTRDAAITMSSISNLVSVQYFVDYAAVSVVHQNTRTLSGLGEPKFQLDGTGFDQPWGRPQRDGPALRSLVLIQYLLKNWDLSSLHGWYEPTLPAISLIKRDLEYVAHEWHLPGFDLWEEINGMHFYTLMVQQASMHIGSKLAKKYKDDGAALFYETRKKNIQDYLERFWDGGRARIVATLGSDRLDVSLILACLHTRNDDAEFMLYRCSSDRIMVSAAKLHGLFQQEYSINHDSNVPLLGRYADDKYNGVGLGLGNPWVLATFSFAEMLYQIAVEFLNKKSIEIQQSNILFYHNVLRLPVKQGTLPQSTCDFYYVIGNLTLLGDQYLDRVIGLGIDFSEQIHRDIAIPQGARDLTWSYSSFVTAFRTREYLKKIIPTTDCL